MPMSAQDSDPIVSDAGSNGLISTQAGCAGVDVTMHRHLSTSDQLTLPCSARAVEAGQHGVHAPDQFPVFPPSHPALELFGEALHLNPQHQRSAALAATDA